MRKKFLLYLCSLLPLMALGQVSSQVSLSNNTRTTPTTGLNLNSITKPSWQNQSFLDSTAALLPNMIRYPGGTTSQYWDWRNGKVLPLSFWQNGTLQNHQNLATAEAVPHRLEDFKVAIEKLGVEPMYVLNVLTDSLESQMAFLRHAKAIGLSVNWIELGNELYFLEEDFVGKYPSPANYASEMRVWIDSIWAEFPNANVAAIGASESPKSNNGGNSPPRLTRWNDLVFPILQEGVDITFHNYYKHGNNVTGVDVNRTFATAFDGYKTKESFTVDSLTQGRKAWWTEYNLRDDLSGNHIVATSWLHGLFTSILHLEKLSNEKNRVIIMHQLTGKEPFGALDSYFVNGDTLSNVITPLGKAITFIHKAEAQTENATQLNFSNNPMQTWNTISYPSLIGWRFQGADTDKLLLLNCSPEAFELDIAAFSDKGFSYEQLSSRDLTRLDPTSEALRLTKGSTSSKLSSVPYSLTVVDLNNTVLNIEKSISHTAAISLYPNPASSTLVMDFPEAFSGKLQLMDINGKVLLEKSLEKKMTHSIDVSTFTSGMYLLRVSRIGKQIFSRKIVVE